MKVLICISMFFLTIESFAQESIKGFIGLSQNVNYPLTITESSFDFGVKFNNEYTTVSISGTYSYGGVFNYNRLFNHHKNFSAYQLDYHLLGGAINYRMRSSEKLYSPTVKLTLLTEIASKYRSGKIIGSSSENKSVSFSPTDHIYEIKDFLYGGSGGPIVFQNYRSYHYISTPLYARLLFGNEFRLNRDLILNIGIGYLFRVFRFYKNEWELNEIEPEVDITDTHSLKDNKYGKIETEGSLGFELGVKYIFSFKTKTK